jgi:putative colanic acid biosynthesis acetyltransferase WcaF
MGDLPPEPTGSTGSAGPTHPTEPFQRLDLCTPLPYTTGEYVRRLAWQLVQATVYRWAPRRAYGWRRMWLRAFGARIGHGVRIRPRVTVFHPWLLDVGDFCGLAEDVVVYNLGPVTIGRQTAISQGAYLCAGTHDHTRPDLPLLQPPVRIGAGVWVAAQAFIGPGVTIGDNAVIAARAVVVQDIPPGVIAAGNPAAVVKRRPMTPISPPSGP